MINFGTKYKLHIVDGIDLNCPLLEGTTCKRQHLRLPCNKVDPIMCGIYRKEQGIPKLKYSKKDGWSLEHL